MASKPNAVRDGTLHADALAAHRAQKERQQSQSRGEGLTSLNRLLQWGAANSSQPDSDVPMNEPRAAPSAEDREWLNAAFPDMYSEVKKLAGFLEEGVSENETVEILQALEEYLSDMNYATNIDRLGILRPVLAAVSSENEKVRAAAVWALGSALQDLREVGIVVKEKDGLPILIGALRDGNAAVRAKAVRAVSAFLRAADEELIDAFLQAGGGKPLRDRVSDEDTSVRRRARFFLMHARHSGNEWLLRDVVEDPYTLTELASSFTDLNTSDVAEVESAVGAVQAVLQYNSQALLLVAPEFPGIVDQVVSRCDDSDSAASLEQLVRSLS